MEFTSLFLNLKKRKNKLQEKSIGNHRHVDFKIIVVLFYANIMVKWAIFLRNRNYQNCLRNLEMYTI